MAGALRCDRARLAAGLAGPRTDREIGGAVRLTKLITGAILTVLAVTLLLAAPAGSFTQTPSTITPADGVEFNGQVLRVSSVVCNNNANTWTASATIDWGDGSAATGGQIAYPGATPANSGTSFTVSGTHTYHSNPGAYTGTVSFTIDCGLGSGNPSGSTHFTANVANQPPQASTISPIGVLTGQPYAGPVAAFTDANTTAGAGQYAATIDWGDGSAVVAGTISAGSGAGTFTVTGNHTYAAAGSFPVTVTIKDSFSGKTVVSEMATVGTAPSSVAFTVNTYTDPVLSRRTLTYAIANPTPGVSYEWDFGDKDSPPGSATAPFVTEATGPTVTYAYPDPPIPASEPTNEFPGSTPTTRFAVYVVRVEALVPGHGTLSATPQNVVVVPVAAPTANFQLLRGSAANGATTGTGASTAVTHPVTIVPQATLPESGSGANDQIVREDFWFNLQPGQTPAISLSEAADLTCLPDGACGHYTGSSLAPAPSQLKAVPGQQDLGTAPITTGPGTPCGGAVVGSPRARAAGEPPALPACPNPRADERLRVVLDQLLERGAGEHRLARRDPDTAPGGDPAGHGSRIFPGLRLHRQRADVRAADRRLSATRECQSRPGRRLARRAGDRQRRRRLLPRLPGRRPGQRLHRQSDG